MASAPHLLAPGDVLHETYRIERLIGVGGTGEVYRAENLAAHRVVAIKVLKREYSADLNFIELMRRELLSDINDDAVVRYYDLLKTQHHGGLFFLVMELIDGPSLAEVMARGPVPVETLLQIGARVASGLKSAHAKNVFHRDISPDNILLRGKDPARATLIDFGIAKDINPGAGTVIGGGFAGKYEYAAPEQMDGQVDGRSDIYALGMTLLAASRGAPPPLPTSLLDIHREKQRAPDLSDAPEPLRSILARMLAPRPEDRAASAAELARTFEAALAEKGGAAPARVALAGLGASAAAPRSASSPRKAPPEPKRKRSVLLPTALAALLALAAGAAFFGRDLLSPQPPLAQPYRFAAADGPTATATGDAPDEAAAERLRAALDAAAGGASVAADLRVARGVPSEEWDDAVAGLLGALATLENWRLDVVGERAVVRGEAPDAAIAEAARAAAETAAETAGFDLETDIRSRTPPIDRDSLAAVMEAFSDCGPLSLDTGPASVRVEGAISSPGAAGDLATALRRVAPGREVDLGVEIRNPFVCRVVRTLPQGGPTPIEVRYLDGASGQRADGDVFDAEANPVIDLVIPSDAEGYLHAVFVDNEGAIVNLLPNQYRAAHQLGAIGEVVDGERYVRIAYPLAEQSERTIALTFVPPFGTYLAAAVVTPEPLFDEVRPRVESIDAFAPALEEALARQPEGRVSAERRFLSVQP